MKTKILLIMITFTFLFSGCTPKTITKIEYKEPPKYNFQKINLTGVQIKIDNHKFIKEKPTREWIIYDKKNDTLIINLSAKEVRDICTPSLIKLNEIYKPSIKFYENQIDEYLKEK